jgi:hypothetical protein
MNLISSKKIFKNHYLFKKRKMIFKMKALNKILEKMKFQPQLMVNKKAQIKNIILKKLLKKKLVLTVYISFCKQNNF